MYRIGRNFVPFAVAVVLAGCGTSGGYWQKEGASTAERDAAIQRCQAEARVTNPRTDQPAIPNAGAAIVVAVGFAAFEGIPHDMAIYRCMEKAGWRDMNKSAPIQPAPPLTTTR